MQSYMEVTVDGGMKKKEVDFNKDFVTPFLLSMAFVVILGFRTSGFAHKIGGGDVEGGGGKEAGGGGKKKKQ